ncbi:TPA: hypothetical protein QHU45_003062 [Escherichia coli]|nr:hypothetical protein [Escherichia coli]HDS5816617.1 hypothetical protein [Escherichia coli]HDS5914430.1 hypothetical protein [Escherichia coli]HDS6081348.1 hypothetical protein [Escherichia coli]HDS7279512.1 hypothetical protein [Escherichia coli]
MNTYLSSLHKRLEVNNQQKDNENYDIKDIYLPYTQVLANKIKTWIHHTSICTQNITLYECDLCKLFKCNKQDLAIAASLIPLYSHVNNINGISVRSYTITSQTVHIEELNDVHLFLLNCLQRGYITTPKDGWQLIIPSANVYNAFVHSPQYQGTNRTNFGRTLSKSGIAKSSLAGNPPYRCRAFKFKNLNNARCEFALNVLNNGNFLWGEAPQ